MAPPKFRPQLESLSDRIVPSATPHANPIDVLVNDATQASLRAESGQLTATDYQVINADVAALQNAYADAAKALLAQYYNLPQSQQTPQTAAIATSILNSYVRAYNSLPDMGYELELSLYYSNLAARTQDANQFNRLNGAADSHFSAALRIYTSPEVGVADAGVSALYAQQMQNSTTGTFDPDNDGDNDIADDY